MKKTAAEDIIKQHPASAEQVLLHKHEIEALRRSERRYKDIFEQANDLIHSVDSAGNILYANKLWRETLGYSEAEIKTMRIFDLVDASCQAKCKAIFSCLMNGDQCEPTETVFKAKDGRKYVMEGRCTPKLEKGKPVELLGIFRDITARKRLEKEKETLISELKEALGKVKALEGILPICASCKMIRDENGKWHQIESYIRARSHAEFSHGICPGCIKKCYPNFSRNDEK